MILNIAIYGAGKTAEIVYAKMKEFLGGTRNQLVYFVETRKTKEEWCGYRVIELKEINPNDFDVLIVAVPDMFELMNISLTAHPECDAIKEKVKFASQITSLFSQEIMPYRSVRIDDDLDFIASSIDYTIGESMYMYGKCFAEDQVKKFFDLMNKYCGFDNKCNGLFLDIGANIGTTCIFAKKKIASNMDYIGFEAGIDNYKMFKCNCIINEVEDIKAEYIALGEKTCKGKYYYNQYNSGGSGVSFDEDQDNLLKIYSLDEYIEKGNISPEMVSCIWLDTEGCEAEILLGAKSLILSKCIPMMQEFNPLTYEERGKDKDYYALMEKAYKHYIDIFDLSRIYEISSLSEHKTLLMNRGNHATDLFFF